MINCVIVDDNELSRKCLEILLKKIAQWHLVASCSNVMEARSFINNNQIDVLFLDVEMPEINGIEFIKTLKEGPAIVMVSSKEKYAIDAFEYEITDYLLKPVAPDRFLKTVNRIESKLAHRNQIAPHERAVFVKVNNQSVKILLNDILWIEANGDYVSVFTDNDRFVIHTTMKAIEEKLPRDQFLRVHRSFIVHLEKIKAIEDTLIVIGKKLIPTGEMYRTDLLNNLKFL